MHAAADMDERGNPLDPYKQLFILEPSATKLQKKATDVNPYDAFTAAWQTYWRDTVLPHAQQADGKLAEAAGHKIWPHQRRRGFLEELQLLA